MAVDYKASSEVSRKALARAGLSTHQAALYEALIHYGPQRATKLAFLAGVPRTLSYKVLDELESDGLVARQDEPGRVSVFAPAHPVKLKELADRRLEEAKGAKTLMEEALPGLVRNFDAMAGALPEADAYAKVAEYAGKAVLGPLSAQERSTMEKSLEDLLKKLRETQK